MKTRVKIHDGKSRFSRPEIELTNSHAGTVEAKFAENLVTSWGMVCGMPDGESSDGSPKMRLMTPAEVVQRAFETSELFFKEAEARGHLLELPDLDAMAESKATEFQSANAA